MIVNKHTKAQFIYNGKTYRILDICWFKADQLAMEPTIVYVDEDGENQSINSGKGKIIME